MPADEQADSRRDVVAPSNLSGTTSTGPPVLSMSPTTHPRSLLRRPPDDTGRLDERVARTSRHVYNTRSVESSMRGVV